jgi:hypothetical protein
LSQFIEKRNDRICFEKQDFCAAFHIFRYNLEVMNFETDEASLPTRNIYGTGKIREVMPHACIGVDVIVGFLRNR